MKFSYSSASTPRTHHFSWGHHFTWGHSCIVSQLKCLKGSSTGKFSYSSDSAVLATQVSLVRCHVSGVIFLTK